MNRGTGGDVTIQLFTLVVATKLNVLGGNPPSCISTTIAAADLFLKANPPGSGVHDSNASNLAGILASYNMDLSSPCGGPTCSNTNLAAPLNTSTPRRTSNHGSIKTVYQKE